MTKRSTYHQLYIKIFNLEIYSSIFPCVNQKGEKSITHPIFLLVIKSYNYGELCSHSQQVPTHQYSPLCKKSINQCWWCWVAPPAPPSSMVPWSRKEPFTLLLYHSIFFKTFEWEFTGF